jgi:sialidase-1
MRIGFETIGPLIASTIASATLAQDIPKQTAPAVKVIPTAKTTGDYRECRRMLVGPGVNQPEAYPGYRGFVGWQSPIVLRDGTMLVGFSSGYWHASPPTDFFKSNPARREEWAKIGMPTDVEAPRGGRAEIIRSNDGGKTWSRPKVLLDTPWDDRAPNFCELKDGTILCSLFTYPGPTAKDLARDPAKTTLTGIIRSFDGGRTWEKEPKRLPVPFTGDATDGPIIALKDGSALICVYGRTVGAPHEMLAFCRSTDRGDTWELLSTLSTDHEMSETAVAQLPDGRLVIVARPEGDVAWSSDGGRTWTRPRPLGVRLFEPRLLPLRDGTLLCLHGSYGAGGLRAMLSTDGGRTWLCPNARWGFPVDPSVYGYGQAVELNDGSVWVVYIHTGGHSTKDARSEALWSIRLRVGPGRDGIEVLRAPGK